MDETLHEGVVGAGFQFASGLAVGRVDNPYPDSTLRLQQPYFRERGVDLDMLVPGWVLGTINIKLSHELKLGRADLTARLVDWTGDLPNPRARIAPESFSFVHCRLRHGGRDYPGLIYYPHPETKPVSVNAHHYDVLEVIAAKVVDLQPGDRAAIICRADAFVPFQR